MRRRPSFRAPLLVIGLLHHLACAGHPPGERLDGAAEPGTSGSTGASDGATAVDARGGGTTGGAGAGGSGASAGGGGGDTGGSPGSADAGADAAGGAAAGGRGGAGGGSGGSGGMATGGAPGHADAGTDARTGGSGGGGGSVGSGGSGGSGGAGADILWRDSIQTVAAAPWGFDGLGVEHPIGSKVSSDAAGANLSRVANPLAGGGFALRHFATFDGGGSRSQAGIYGFANDVFSRQAKSNEGIWIAQEWFFPQAITAGGDIVPWINLWDWHSTNNGGDRWHTCPGLMLAEDGSMRVKWEWGTSPNPDTGLSSVALPVGQWVDVEMHYKWTTSKNVTLSLWINGALALEQSGVQTANFGHNTVDTYSKFYGSSNGGHAWSPPPSVRYTRNVRISNQRIWR